MSPVNCRIEVFDGFKYALAQRLTVGIEKTPDLFPNQLQPLQSESRLSPRFENFQFHKPSFFKNLATAGACTPCLMPPVSLQTVRHGLEKPIAFWYNSPRRDNISASRRICKGLICQRILRLNRMYSKFGFEGRYELRYTDLKCH